MLEGVPCRVETDLWWIRRAEPSVVTFLPGSSVDVNDEFSLFSREVYCIATPVLLYSCLGAVWQHDTGRLHHHLRLSPIVIFLRRGCAVSGLAGVRDILTGHVPFPNRPPVWCSEEVGRLLGARTAEETSTCEAAGKENQLVVSVR